MSKENIFSLPNEKGGYTQPNKSDSSGDIFMTYGIDLNKGRIDVSEQVKKLINNDDNADFGGYAGSIGTYTDKIFAISGWAFSANDTTPLGTWSKETSGTEPDSGNTVMDSAYFDGLFLVSESDDIKAYNGTTWSSWWQTTLGQSALDSGRRHLLWVGTDGNLYIVDMDATKVYRVTPTGTVTKTGAGSLDFSATSYEITSAVTTSNRSWIGTKSLVGEEAAIIEWDMSPSASTANKFHKVNAKEVVCIAVWNDTPVAVLSTGKVKYFNGVSFVDFERSMQFPVPEGYEMAEGEDFIHPNGWAIIDDLPHFLVAGRVDTTPGAGLGAYYFPSGGWCLDPNIGLYHRFALGSGLSTQEDYGQIRIKTTGALYSLQSSDSKFLASYDYYDAAGATKSTLVYHDAANSQPSRGFLMTAYKFNLRELWKQIEVFHKKLENGAKIKIYYRNEKTDIIGKAGVWSSTTAFHITGTGLGITQGDVAFVKVGGGAGQLLRVASATETATLTIVTFTEAADFVSVSDQSTLDFLNFRFMGEITNETTDAHTFTIPGQNKNRKTQFLFEFHQPANTTIEVDYIVGS